MLWGTSAHHEQLRARYRERLEKESGENGRVFYCEHRLGLPVAEGAKISINMTDASYTFRATNDETWELPKSRITNVSKMTETEIQTHLKSSLGTTILGGAVAGFPDAFVGSLVTTPKNVAVRSYYLVFNYLGQDSEPQMLLFQYNDSAAGMMGYQKPKMFVKDFQQRRDLYAPVTNHLL